jgi:hypothetical protein
MIRATWPHAGCMDKNMEKLLEINNLIKLFPLD